VSVCEGTPLFSLRAVGPTGRRQGHIYRVRGKCANIWGLRSELQIPKGSRAYPPASRERERWRAGTPNIGARRCPVEFFLRYGLSKKGVPSLHIPRLFTPAGLGFIPHQKAHTKSHEQANSNRRPPGGGRRANSQNISCPGILTPKASGVTSH
jgi:hypothetical protein